MYCRALRTDHTFHFGLGGHLIVGEFLCADSRSAGVHSSMYNAIEGGTVEAVH